MLLSVIIPVFNEKNTIAEILKRVEGVNLDGLSFRKEVIIVDDGSTDGTKEILEKSKIQNPNLKIVFHERNLGKGAAIQTGLKHVSGDYVVIQDADLEYDPQDYKNLLQRALQNNASVVYGSRRLNFQNKPIYSSYYWGGIFLNWLTNFICGIKITDESTGYKLFKTALLKSIPLRAKGFAFDPEITAKLAKRKIKIWETAISYEPRRIEEGKKVRWRDGLFALWALLKYKFVD